MRDLGYDSDESDDDLDDRDNVDNYRTRALQLLIDSTRNKVEENLEEAQLAKRDVFIVSSSVMLSLVTAKRRKKTPAIDEARLMEAISFTAHARRYGNQASGMENRLLTNSYSLSLTCGSG